MPKKVNNNRLKPQEELDNFTDIDIEINIEQRAQEEENFLKNPDYDLDNDFDF